MIYWTKKKILKKSFQEISKDFIKNDFWINDFNLFIYKKKKNQFIFSISFVFNFQKRLFTLIVSKEFITKFQFRYKNYFYLLLLENNEFLQFYLQKYFDSFSFKKSDFYKLFKVT